MGDGLGGGTKEAWGGDGTRSPGALGAPKQGQLVGGEVSVEEGEALQDALHQALGGGMLLSGSGSTRLWTSGHPQGPTRTQARGSLQT